MATIESAIQYFVVVSKQLSATKWLITSLIGILLYATFNLSTHRKKLPPGPFPLPFIGNILSFVGKTPQLKIMENFYKTHGNVYTLWLGSKPHVIVNSWDALKESLVLRKDDFSGRPYSRVTFNMFRDSQDIVVSDMSPTYVIHKKMGSTAVRKYIDTPNFAEVVYDNAMNFVSLLINQNGPFDPASNIYEMLCNILEVIALGECKTPGENTHLFKNAIKAFEDQVGNGFPSDYFPILTPFFWGRERILRNSFYKCLDHINEKLQQHKLEYKKDDIKDFIDAILASREETDECDKSSIIDGNITSIVVDLFLASVATTHQSIMWLILQIANDKELQNKIYLEIDNNIGYRKIVPEDREKCPYTQAAISEVLRHRAPLPLLFPHKTTRDTMIGEHNIPCGTTIMFNVDIIHHSQESWENPHCFKPERFLDKDGHFSDRLAHYAPFGLGRRTCPGEKMARTDIFMIIGTILQKCEINLENGPGTGDLTADTCTFFQLTKPYRIVAKQRI